MNITVKTGGLLGKYLPPGGNGKQAELEVAEGATPIDVLRQLGMPLEKSYLVSLNGTALPKAERESRSLEAGDTLAIMPPLKGG